MRVVIDMARVAIAARIRFVHRNDVARLALEHGMAAHKRKFSKGVVAEAIVCPADLAMAGSTIFTQQARMRIIFLVTGYAGPCQLRIDRAVDMTLLAARLLMRPP